MIKKGDLKREFEEFSQKVASLKLLREELDTLNVRGFESEAGLIRAKLKNVDAIPEIKREIEDLREKISKKDVQKLIEASKRIPDNVIKETGKLRDKFEELKSAFDRHSVKAELSIKRKIDELEEAIKAKKRIAGKKQLSRNEVDYVKDIPNIIKEVRGLKESLTEQAEKTQNSIKEKIKVLEEIAGRKKKIASKKQLSRDEVNYVKDLPGIEKSIKELSSQLNEHLEKSWDIHKEIPLLEGKFREFKNEFRKSNEAVKESIRDKINVLEEIIEKKRALAGKKQLSKDDVKAVKEIPVLETKLDMLREQLEKEGKASFSALKGKINELQDLIERKRILSVKKQLSKEEVAYINDIPQLEKQLNELKNLLEKHDKKSGRYDEGISKLESEFSGLKEAFKKHAESFRLPVDSDVGIAVDRGFGEFLESLKTKLSKEVEEKKADVQRKLARNFEQQEKEFIRKYKEMANEMHKEYERKVREELRNEVERRFNEELNRKMESESGRIRAEESDKMAEELEIERKEMHHHLETLYNKRRKELGDSFANEIEGRRTEIIKQEKLANEKLERRKAVLARREQEFERRAEARIEEEKRALEGKERELSQKMEEAEEEEKKLIEEELKALRGQRENLNIELEKRVNEEKRILEVQMRKEYDKRLADAIKAQKARIDEEKKDFEQHVLAQARKLFR